MLRHFKSALHKCAFGKHSSERNLSIFFYEKKHKKSYKSKVFYFCKSIVLPISISYACYYFYRKLKNSVLKQSSVDFLPHVHALENTEGIKNSPRSKYNFLADVAEKTAPSVVYIEIVAKHPISRQSIPISNGSGFIVKSDGLILTNAHVVSHNGEVNVKLYDGQEFKGVVESFDTGSDLATVRIQADGLPVLSLGQSSNLRAGEFVIAMGNPLTLSHTITAGVISSANRQGKDIGLHKKSDYIQTDAAVNVGNSGGPLVNLDCEAIGINTMKVTEGISFAVPSDRAIEFLKRSEKTKDSRVPFRSARDEGKQKFLGITMLTLTPSIIQELQERKPDFPDVKHGVMVWRVMIGSPSFDAGIKHGDIITAINDKPIHSASDIYSLLKSEDVLHIHIIRKKKEFDVSVELLDPIVP